ncbi:MAG: type I-B CRISPR-associated protein Cas5b [bacterium]
MKVLAFNIWGDYAHFRKFYTTSSPLTFSFPPPSTIAGILGAIYGAGKEEYLDIFSSQRCHIAIKIINPVKKIRMGINLINTKGNFWIPYGNQYHEPRTQIRTEFVKEPSYMVYVNHQDPKIFDTLCKNIKEHKSFYTVSLGLSELLADFEYAGIYNSEETLSNDELTELCTPVIITNLISDGLGIEEGKKYFKEKMPIIMNQKRIVGKYDDVIFEPEGNTIKARVKTYHKLENGENIVFF